MRIESSAVPKKDVDVVVLGHGFISFGFAVPIVANCLFGFWDFELTELVR